MVNMNKLSAERRASVVAALVEGNSIRAVCRMTGTAKGTVTRLLVELGRACNTYQYQTLQRLTCQRVQVDEIWSFCYAKEKNVPRKFKGDFGYGDVWTFTAICADTKLVPCWRVCRRDGMNAMAFMADLQSRLSHRVQLTTDGHSTYVHAVEATFGANVDYAMLIKEYGHPAESELHPDTRYSPPTVTGIEVRELQGHPDPDHISTSYVERQNLTMRMGMRRMTRLTNGFSKKIENLSAAVALHFMHYNFCRVHQTLGKTPAMAAGISDHVWKPIEIARLLGSN
jgi:IS1 family transposase